MQNGTKALLLPNEAKDTASAFLAFLIEEQEDFSDAWGEMEGDDEFVRDMMEIQHYADDDFLMEHFDDGKVLDYYDHRELCDPDEDDLGDDFFPYYPMWDGNRVV